MKNFKKSGFIITLCFAINFLSAQSKDSLITEKKTYKTEDQVNFTVKLAKNPKLKTDQRRVPTMSCACGNIDFYYKLYRLESNKHKTLILDHTEKENAPKCQCKSGDAIFANNQTRFISPYKQMAPYQKPTLTAGEYVIEIEGNDFKMISNHFTITN